MSINLNMNQGQDVSEGQSASQPPSSDNISIPLQAPFIPTIPMQYPQAGLFAQWLSTPSGSTPSQNPPYYQFNSQPTSSQIPPHYQQNPHPTPLQNLPHYQQNSQPTPLQNPLYHVPTSNVARSETPIIPGTQESSTGSISGVTERGATCIPILNGPASRDIPHPPGQKITKGAHGRKKQRLSDAQEAASLTFRAGLVSLQASTNARWEKSREDQLVRDKINNQVLQVELHMQAKQHDLDLAKSRANIIDKITASGEMLLLAVQKLDEFGTESVLTPTQKLQYEVRQRAVALHKKQYAELNESLKRTEFQSLTCMEPMFDNPRAGTSQRHLDLEDDEANLGDD